MTQDDEYIAAWDPVPRAINRYMALIVKRFEHVYQGQGMQVSVTVKSATAEDVPRNGMWRIEFKGIGSFRYRLFDDISYPGRPGNVTAGAWEIINSRWLRETRHPGPRPEDMHHYVITSTEVAYDIAALIWTSEPLDATAADLEQ